jgi:hypothetical protein
VAYARMAEGLTGTYSPCWGLWGHVALQIKRTDLCTFKTWNS